MTDRMAEVVAAVRAHRYRFMDEVGLQAALAQVFASAGWAYEREVQMSATDRIDFLLGDLGVEVKVGGSTGALTRQAHRYVQHDRVGGLLVVTSRLRHARLPPTISGKPVCVVALLPGLT